MSIKWGYALNQWKPQFDDFVRRRDHERALKTISIAGFTGVELAAGSGRWEPFGNPVQIAANFGSVPKLLDFVRSCGVDAVSSYYFDPETRFGENLSHGHSALKTEDRDSIVQKARWFAEALAQVGGSVLVVRPAPSAWRQPELTQNDIEVLAACWNAVGKETSALGIRTALHMDFLSALRGGDALERLMAATDPELVGLVMDTGELAVSGIDALEFLQKYGDRVWHVQFKDAAAVDSDNEYLAEHADHKLRQVGGARRVPRWFLEPGQGSGLVDFPVLTAALTRGGYTGWVVVETDPSPHPATSALLSGWYLKNVLLSV